MIGQLQAGETDTEVLTSFLKRMFPTPGAAAVALRLPRIHSWRAVGITITAACLALAQHGVTRVNK